MGTHSVLAAVLFAAPLTAADVIVVDAGGAGDYTTLTAAVAAAVDGDLLLVKHGEYFEPGPVVIFDKALTIAGEPIGPSGADIVRVREGLVVRDLSGGRQVVLQNLWAAGLPSSASAAATPGLQLLDNNNHVRLQHTTLQGGGGGDDANPGGAPGLSATNSASVALVHSAASGGGGQFSPDLHVPTGPGGHGIHITGGQLALVGSVAGGGWGGSNNVGAWPYGGDGGHGVLADGADVFMSSATIRGGDGGIAHVGGAGGAGLVLTDTDWALRLADTAFFGGQGGFSDVGPHGPNGAQLVDPLGSLFAVTGTRHTFDLTSPVREGEVGTFEFGGEVGDSILLFLSLDLHLLPLAGYQGVFLLGPATLFDAIALPAPGDIDVPFIAPDLPVGLEHLDLHVQAAYPGPDGAKLGPGLVLTLVDGAF